MKTQTKVKEQVKIRVSIDLENLMFQLFNIKGTTFVQMQTRTEPKMRKTNNPYLDNVIKESDVNCMLGGAYENNVNSARVREGIAAAKSVGVDKETLDLLMAKFNTTVENFTPTFTAKPHKWADHSENPLTEQTSRIIVEKRSDPTCKYVQVWILDTKDPVYRWKDSNEIIDDETLEKVKSFIPQYSSNKENQGLEKELIIRDYAIGNIKEITMNKVHYFIK